MYIIIIYKFYIIINWYYNQAIETVIKIHFGCPGEIEAVAECQS